MHVTRNVVLQLLCIVGDKCALLAGALATLSAAHLDFTARENVSVAHVLPNKDLLVIVRVLVIEAYEAELRAEDLG